MITTIQNHWMIIAGALIAVFAFMFFEKDLLAAAFIFGLLTTTGFKTWREQQ